MNILTPTPIIAAILNIETSAILYLFRGKLTLATIHNPFINARRKQMNFACELSVIAKFVSSTVATKIPPPIAAFVNMSFMKLLLTFSLFASKVRKNDGIPIVIAEIIVNWIGINANSKAKITLSIEKTIEKNVFVRNREATFWMLLITRRPSISIS